MTPRGLSPSFQAFLSAGVGAPYHICSLRPLCTLDDFEFNRVPFVQGFVSLAYDCRVMYKYIRTIHASNEAVPFCVIEPLDCAFHFLVNSDGIPKSRFAEHNSSHAPQA
jgi:hypothetical protein